MDMKVFKYIAMSLFLTMSLVSCNTENDDFDIEYTAIHPIGGQYTVDITDETGTVVAEHQACYLANTSDNSSIQCWIRIGNYNASAALASSINGKIGCSVADLTFSGSNVMNLAGNVTTATETFNVVGGKIELNGVEAPSGTIADKISFTYTRTNFPGKTYTVTGYRYTGWPED